MATQEEFLDLVWANINQRMQEQWIDAVIPHSTGISDAHFAEVALAVKRLLALGAARRDLSLLVRHGAYEEARAILYLLSDPGINDNDVENLHELFIDAGPTGEVGGLGPAPEKQIARKSKLPPKKGEARRTTEPKPEKRKLIKWSADVQFSPDGTMLASVGMGLTLWKCPEIQQLAKISSVSNPCSVAFSPDSRLLAVKSTSGRIALIDALTQSVKIDFRNQADGEGSNVVFADDGQHVVDGSWAGRHTVRTLEGDVTFREDFTRNVVMAVLRHPDGRFWFIHGERMIGRAWPFQEGKYEQLSIPIDRLSKAVFSPDGRSLAVTARSNPASVTLFSFPAMEMRCSAPLPKSHQGNPLSFSPCGRILAVVGEVVTLFDATTLVALAELPIAHGMRVAFSPIANLMAVGGSPGEVFDTTRFLNALP